HPIVAFSCVFRVFQPTPSPEFQVLFDRQPQVAIVEATKKMCHFLSHSVERVLSSAASQFRDHSLCSTPASSPSPSPGRRLYLNLLLVCLAFLSSSFAQQPFSTSHADNTRSNANTNETLLAPSNVNQYSFGHLFSAPVDYVVMAQPLYVPNVNIPNQGTHNVIYVATQADSVYAIDADTGAQLWYASMLTVALLPVVRISLAAPRLVFTRKASSEPPSSIPAPHPIPPCIWWPRRLSTALSSTISTPSISPPAMICRTAP